MNKVIGGVLLTLFVAAVIGIAAYGISVYADIQYLQGVGDGAALATQAVVDRVNQICTTTHELGPYWCSEKKGL